MSLEINSNREQRFKELKSNKPCEGDVLTSKDGQPVKVRLEKHKDTGRIAFIVTVIIDEDATGWYLSNEKHGLKAIIMNNSKMQLIAQNYGATDDLRIDQLRVVRRSDSGKALLCELIKSEN
jgi:hypothetical protein